jgi:hypothetical protein
LWRLCVTVASAGAVWWAGGYWAGLVTFNRWSGVTAGHPLLSFKDFLVSGGSRCGGIRPGVRRWWECHGPEADGRRALVAGAGGLSGFLDGVAVVAGAFDRAGATAVPAFGVGPVRDLGQDLGHRHIPVLRGEKPPSRWRYGGPGAACGCS